MVVKIIKGKAKKVVELISWKYRDFSVRGKKDLNPGPVPKVPYPRHFFHLPFYTVVTVFVYPGRSARLWVL